MKRTTSDELHQTLFVELALADYMKNTEHIQCVVNTLINVNTRTSSVQCFPNKTVKLKLKDYTNAMRTSVFGLLLC